MVGCAGLALLLDQAGADPLTQAVTALLVACAGACAGFLVWNWPPARIFMGDVGSTALGLAFALGVTAGMRAGIPVDVLILPLLPFIADATCTLARRAWRRERLSQAHRSHLYQRLARHWSSHRAVTCFWWSGGIGWRSGPGDPGIGYPAPRGHGSVAGHLGIACVPWAANVSCQRPRQLMVPP